MRKKNFKRVQALVLTAALVLPVVPVQAEATSVEIGDYVVTGDIGGTYEAHGSLYVRSNGKIDVSMKEGITETSQRIYIERNTTGTITFSDVHINKPSECVLIDKDVDVTFVFPENTESSFSSETGFGIFVAKDSKLTIAGEGTVNAETNGAAAGIGGGWPDESGEKCAEINIQGATVNASSMFGAAIGSAAETEGCKVVIDGGIVNASSRDGAGIGAGYGDDEAYSGGTVIINDGVVNVETEQGVGIGGSNGFVNGGDGADLTINGGTVTVNTGGTGTAIGGGNGPEQGGNGGTFTMNGGNVTVTSYLGTTIGGGMSDKKGGNGCDITINGGTLTAMNQLGFNVIGGGFGDDEDGENSESVGGDGGSLTIHGGIVSAQAQSNRENASAIGGGYGATRGKNTVVTVQPQKGNQIQVESDWNDSNPKEVEGSPFTSGENVVNVVPENRYFKATTSIIPKNTGDFIVSGEGEYNFDSGILTIEEDGDYTVAMKYGVSETSDRIVVASGVEAKITLQDVDIHCERQAPVLLDQSKAELIFPKNTKSILESDYGSAICVPSQSELIISGEGTVNANGGGPNAAIGSSFVYGDDDCGTIQIKGGIINATSLFGAVIGGFVGGNGGTVLIDGGIINLSSDHAAGIGSGIGNYEREAGNGGTVTINDGTITINTVASAGIGGGSSEDFKGGDGAVLTVNGGSVTVNVMGSSTGIGGGCGKNAPGGNGGVLIMNGGDVTVRSFVGPAIGGGVSTTEGGCGCDIVMNGGILTAINLGGFNAIGGGLAVGNELEGDSTIGGDGGNLTINGGTIIAQVKNRENTSAISGGQGTIVGKDTNVIVNQDGNNLIRVEVGSDENNLSEIAGSPFKKETTITKSLNGKNYFKASVSEATQETIAVSDDVKVEGYQINANAGGARTVASVPKTLNGKQVVKRGVVYALAKVNGKSTGVNDDDMVVNGESYYVKGYDLSNAPTLSLEKADPDRTYFAITMLFANGGSKKEFEATYKVRSYVELEDGTIVYSDIDDYSIYAISDVLYQNQKMQNRTWHNYLYENILKVVDPSYKEVDYDWNKEIVKLK